MCELDEEPRHPVLAHDRSDVVPAPDGHRVGPRSGRRGHGDVRRGESRVAVPLVEQDGQVVGVVEPDTAPQFPCRPGEPCVPACRSLDPRGVVDVPQQPVDLRVLAGRVEPDGLVGREVGSARPQDLGPGHDARCGQSGRPYTVGEEGDSAVLRVTHDGEAHGRAGRRGGRPGPAGHRDWLLGLHHVVVTPRRTRSGGRCRRPPLPPRRRPGRGRPRRPRLRGSRSGAAGGVR